MSQPQAIYLSDYRPPAYRVTHTELTFDLDPAATRVKARLHVERHPEREAGEALELDGEQLTLKSIAIDGQPLEEDEYQLTEQGLRVARVPSRFLLDTEVEIAPERNTALEALSIRRHVLHPVRGGRLSSHHLLSGPPGRHGHLLDHGDR